MVGGLLVRAVRLLVVPQVSMAWFMCGGMPSIMIHGQKWARQDGPMLTFYHILRS